MKQELQSFLGAVNYLQMFVPHLSSNTEPLCALLKKENCFTWDKNTNTCFQKIKSQLQKALLRPLRYYDQTKLVTLQCDTSLKGLRACIIQDGQPIAFASKSLTDTETRYANIKRELLAIVYGCEKFHTYLYRRTFIVETDHKPLKMISLKNLTAAPAWLQRMLLHLQQYDLIITYRPGKEMLLADALSCLPSRTNTEIKLDLRVDTISTFAFSQRHLTKIAAVMQWNPILLMVHQLTLNGWPDRQGCVPRAARFYWSFQDELSIDDDLLTKGEWVVIPLSCRDSIMVDLHGSHTGINKAMDLARTCVYWPDMEADVADYIKWCLTCIESSNLPVEMLHPHKVPPGPWVKIGVDFFQDHLGKKHLIVADYFSKFPYVFPVVSTHHFKTISHLWELFAAEGIPAIVLSDNRPPFNGDEFRQFSHDFDFIHTTLSPHFHQSNSFIKSMVKKVKNAYKKMDRSPNAQAKALLQLCDTPIKADLPSPAEILHGRPAQGTVLSRPSRKVNICQICQRLVELQEKQKEQFDRAHQARDLHPLKVQEWVQFFQNKQATGPIKWTTGTVVEILECGWSYMIRGPNGRVYRRNWAHLKPICHDGSSFQDHPVMKGEKLPKDNSFQEHQARSVSFNNKVSYINDEASYMDTGSMMFDSPETHQTPPASPAMSPARHHSPRSPSFSPPASLPFRESSVEPSSEDSPPEGRKRHQSEPAFIRPHDVDQGLTPGLSALLAETSPLAPYWRQRQAKAKAQEKISTHKWVISRPFGSFQDHLAHFKTIMCLHRPPWTVSLHRPPWTTFKTTKKEKIMNFLTPIEDRWQKRQLDNLIHHHHCHHFVYINILCTLVTLKVHFKTILNGIV